MSFIAAPTFMHAERRHELLETVVADARTGGHAAAEDHVAHLKRRVAYGRRHPRLAAVGRELGSHHRHAESFRRWRNESPMERR
jgi:hypothetical protein